jgi:hypothetical protein
MWMLISEPAAAPVEGMAQEEAVQVAVPLTAMPVPVWMLRAAITAAVKPDIPHGGITNAAS